MSTIVTTPVSKIKSGISSAIKSPANFIVSLGIGFTLGVIADLIMQYIWIHGLGDILGDWKLPTPGFSPYFMHPGIERIAGDDVILIIINIFLLFTRKFVLTFGFFLGWYMSSNWDLYGAIEEIPK